MSQSVRNDLAKAPFNLEEYKLDLDIIDVFGEEGYSTNERNSIRPSLDVNGIWGGYTGKEPTVLPSKAYAKISMRLYQTKALQKSLIFSKHLKITRFCKSKVTPHHGGEEVITIFLLF